MFSYGYNPSFNQGFNQGPGYNAAQTQQPNSLIRVTGLEGAKAYQMPANSTVALFDGNDNLFYVKTTDGAGFPTIRTFKFEEVAAQMSGSSNDYVSRKEMEEYVQRIIQKSDTQQDESNAVG